MKTNKNKPTINLYEKSYGGGFPIFLVWTILMITLKVMDVISCSWWLVLLPVWISLGLWTILIFLLIIASIVAKK